MSAVMDQIDRMTTEEKFKTMDYIWSSISVKSIAGCCDRFVMKKVTK